MAPIMSRGWSLALVFSAVDCLISSSRSSSVGARRRVSRQQSEREVVDAQENAAMWAELGARCADVGIVQADIKLAGTVDEEDGCEDVAQAVYDATRTKRLYYSKFFSAAVRERGLKVADKAAGQPKEQPSWQSLLQRKKQKNDGDVELAKKAWLSVAERQHARAALFGSATLLAAPLDAERLWPLFKFARCGCPAALEAFSRGVPNLLVEAPIFAALVGFSAYEYGRFKNVDAGEAAGPGGVAATWSNAELVQGRVAMLISALSILALPLNTLAP